MSLQSLSLSCFFARLSLVRSTLQDTGKDPITQAEASVEDLVEVKNNQVSAKFSTRNLVFASLKHLQICKDSF